MSKTKNEVSVPGAQITKGRLIPGFEKEGIPFFILDFSKKQEDKDAYCADCGAIFVDNKVKGILYINDETRRSKEGYRRKKVCVLCCEEKYTLPLSEASREAPNVTLGSILNAAVHTIGTHSSVEKGMGVKESILNKFFDYFDRPAYLQDSTGHIYVSVSGQEGKMENNHIEGDSFQPTGFSVY